jgi:type IV fimbrial biogenesis protein FimT
MRRASGFTLIEMMVVVLVAAVLALVAAPSLTSLIAKQRLRSAASSLHLAMVQARAEAIKRNTSVTVSPAAGGWSSGWSILDPENPGGPALEVVAIPQGVVVTTTVAQVVYRGNGRTTSDAAMSFGLTGGADGASRCVKIEGTGRPYSKEGSCE